MNEEIKKQEDLKDALLSKIQQEECLYALLQAPEDGNYAIFSDYSGHTSYARLYPYHGYRVLIDNKEVSTNGASTYLTAGTHILEYVDIPKLDDFYKNVIYTDTTYSIINRCPNIHYVYIPDNVKELHFDIFIGSEKKIDTVSLPNNINLTYTQLDRIWHEERILTKIIYRGDSSTWTYPKFLKQSYLVICNDKTLTF